MKTLKINFATLCGVVIVLVTASIELFSAQNLQNSGWYEVDGDDIVNIHAGPLTNPGSGCDTNLPNDICAINWPDAGSPPPSTLQAALDLFEDADLAGRQP